MFLTRSAIAVSRRAASSSITRRAFSAAIVKRSDSSDVKPQLPAGAHTGRNMDRKLEDIKTEADLMPEGANPGTIPSDLEQATGLERLEILGKMQGIDIFDMRPLQSDRVGTLTDPIYVKSFGDEQYAGCTGCPADSHHVLWLTMSQERPLTRCPECGSCYRMEYVGPPEDPHAHEHGHEHHGHKDPETFANYVKPEYYYR